jgi:DNA primase
VGIAEEDVARVREATDFIAIAGEHIALKRVGTRFVGLCPFHAEKSGSFSVNAELGLYYCFGCQAKGDAITFVREVRHLDFVEAVEFLAAKAGIELRYDDAAGGKDRQRRGVLVDAMEKAVEWYHERLLKSDDGGPARNYLRNRGYDGDLVRAFKLGWAPDDWDTLSRALKLPDDVLRDTGLGFVNRRQRQQDAFRARVMFPIFDVSGKPVAFGGRIMQGAEGPKYKNSPETPIYSKRRTLYGLNWAKADVVEAGEVIVCEGYTDVIGFFQAAVPRAVATCGTALADEHFNILKNFARRVVLAYDADAAGQAAAERFYEWERRFDIDVYVLALPAGADPADIARRDPEALRTAVKDARPFLAFRLDRVLDGADMRTPEGRARAAQAAADVIREHPNDLVRDQYLMQVADRCRVDADRLRAMLAGQAPAAVPSSANGAGNRNRRAPVGPEVEALRLLVHRPDDVRDRLAEVLFVDDVDLAAYRALMAAPSVALAIEQADPEASALLQRLAVEEADSEPDDVVTRLVQRAGARALAGLEAEARHSPDRALSLSPLVGWLKLTVEQAGDPDAGLAAGERLVAWLTERQEMVSE